MKTAKTPKQARYRRIVSTLLIILSVLGICVQTYASSSQTDLNSYSYYKNNVDVDPWTYLTSPYFPGASYAIDAWNFPAAPCNASITSTTTSQNKMYITNLNYNTYGYYGIMSVNSSTYHKTNQFFIDFNNMDGYATPTSSTNLKKSVACHELGHALGLADDGSQSYSIMNNSRNRESVTKPFVTDCYGVYANWLR